VQNERQPDVVTFARTEVEDAMKMIASEIHGIREDMDKLVHLLHIVMEGFGAKTK
jgi:hypothetical protein